MSVALSSLLTEISDKTRNSTTGALDNNKRTRAINRVLQDLQDFADWEFTKRTKEFEFIDGVNEYSLLNYIGTTCQDNDGSTSIVDFKNPRDLRIVDSAVLPFEYKEARDVRYNIQNNRRVNEYAVDNDLLIINYARQTSAQIHNCDSLTANGTWTASGDATNLTIDTVEKAEGSGSLNFDTSSGTSLIITNPSLSSKNLTEFKNVSHWTAKIDLPTITNFSSVTLRWGSSASNYYEVTVTTRADGNSVIAGRNLFAFRWADATETGTPDVSAINYAQLTITYSSAVTDTDFRVDDLRVGKSVDMKLDYFSLAMVQDSAGDYQLEFNPSSVTQTDTLLGDSVARRTVTEGAVYELFWIIGGKSERDRTDSKSVYDAQKNALKKRAGHRIRRPSRILRFPGNRGQIREL